MDKFPKLSTAWYAAWEDNISDKDIVQQNLMFQVQ